MYQVIKTGLHTSDGLFSVGEIVRFYLGLTTSVWSSKISYPLACPEYVQMQVKWGLFVAGGVLIYTGRMLCMFQSWER